MGLDSLTNGDRLQNPNDQFSKSTDPRKCQENCDADSDVFNLVLNTWTLYNDEGVSVD
jgi:hypothetical protein